MKAGRQLWDLRMRRRMSLEEVHELSRKLVRVRRNSAFLIPKSRLSQIESQGAIPSIYKLYALSVIYRAPLRKLLAFYGLK